MSIRTIAIALLLGAPLASQADARFWSPDASLESTTATLTEPLVEGGLLMAKSCDTCRSYALRMTDTTRLFIGDREVSVAELNQFLAGGSVHNLGISFDKTAETVTKLVVFAKLPPRPAANRS